MKEYIKATTNDIISFMYDLFLKNVSNSTLLIDGYAEDDEYGVAVNSYGGTLYCIELSSVSNIEHFVSNEIIDSIFTDHKTSEIGSIVWCLLKKQSYQKNYIFSYNLALVTELKDALGAILLGNEELTNVLYDIFLNNEFPIDVLNKKINRSIDIVRDVPIEEITYTYGKLVQDAVYKNIKSAELFQGYKTLQSNKTRVGDLFNIDFDGVVFQYIDFTQKKVDSLLRTKIDMAKKAGQSEPLEMLRDDYNANKVELALINTTVLIKDYNEVKNPISKIGSCLNMKFLKKEISKGDAIRHTMIKSRDSFWDLFEAKDFFYNHISTVHKSNVDKPDFYGYDVNGSFWNYNFQKTTNTAENKSASILIIGVTGSGKTAATNKFLASILKLDYLNSKIYALDQNYIRDFDIKYSGKIISDLVEQAGQGVQRIKADLNHFRFNLLDANMITDGFGKLKPDQNDIMMNAYLVSFILDSMDENGEKTGLTSNESSIFKELVSYIYNEKDWTYSYIMSFKDTHPTIYNELINLGYSSDQTTDEIKEAAYEFLKKPKLEDLIRVLKIFKEDDSDKEQQKAANSLYGKLNIVHSMKIFSSYDAVSPQDSKYTYIDFDSIKESPFYVPIFLSLFTRIYAKDRKSQAFLEANGKFRPTIYYNFTEAANIFMQPTFRPYMIKLMNEVRSYGIRIIFSTQLIEQVPKFVIDQVGTIITLFPEAKRRAALISKLNDIAHLDEDTIKLLQRTKKYYMAVISEHGTSVVRQDMTKEEVDMYGQETESSIEYEEN